jgi:hypothetical protein
MADNDSNTVKPVEILQNIPILTPAGRREQRKNRRQPHGEKRKDSVQEQNNLDDEQSLDSELAENENDRSASGGIDYCA